MATEQVIRGIGHSVERKEDARFIRGKGTYVDDVSLPGMLHLELLRAPFAHARIRSIDTSAAAALPGVVAVVTGELMAEHGLAWMPTLSGDSQAVLATDKVRFQGQEVAAVVAEDVYTARDALELIEVDYEPLPAIVDPRQALEEGAPVIRDDKEGQDSNHIYHWESGDAGATERAFAEADKVVTLDTHYPRCHPAPLECCGCVADVNPATGKATIYMTSQAPHAHRTLFAMVAGLPEHQIRIISPDIGGGFGNKVPIYPGYVVATAASLLLGKPVKWMEDRTGNLISTGFARDYHMHGELALKGDRMTGLRVKMHSDNGAFFADAQPSKGKEYDIAGLRMFDSAELRVHPTGKAVLKLGVKSQGQGHETTFAQIVAEELGLPPEDVEVQEGDTDNTPYGLGTYASRSTPTAGAATAVISRQLRDKAREIAAHKLEAAPDDIDFDAGRFFVKGSPERAVTIQDVALAAYTDLPDGMEAGLEGVDYYDPPNMTFPFGTYAVVVEVDRGTGQWKPLRVVAVDDCGVRINPMIVEGQITGGLTEGYGIAAMQLITFDEEGNCVGSNFMDYLLPTAWETPTFEMDQTVTPSPHHPLGAKGVGESATVGSPAAYVNAVIDALAHAGVRNIEMPLTSDRVWEALNEAGLSE